MFLRASCQGGFRQHLGGLFQRHGWEVDPGVWGKKWGVHIQTAGSGAATLKYLGAYVARTAIADSRVMKVDEQEVTFWWKDREQGNRREVLTLPGVEFVRRYLRHVLPVGLRSVRYYGFCHPAAKANRLRVRFHTGSVVSLGADQAVAKPSAPVCCPHCQRPMRLVCLVSRLGVPRAPPGTQNVASIQPCQAA